MSSIRILLARCPRCAQHMKYQQQRVLTTQRKQCVYCGKSFLVRGNVLKPVNP
ncbi:MAG TPA: hypothetical protein VJC16_07080 [Candidatus Nanoarchaeia archaeon]|nr:hypothetical protein [Candidatus Nanoarchaeia archaeon]